MSREGDGLILCVSGPSGVGKDTIINALIASRLGMCHSVSMTTRAPRPGEKDGIDYHFVTPEAFQAALDAGDILECDEYCGHRYGTPAGPIHALVRDGVDVVLDITVKGAKAVAERFPDAVTVFLVPPSMRVLWHRLVMRKTESEATMRSRLARARDELALADGFDYVVVNDKVSATIETLRAIYEAERHRAVRLRELVARLRDESLE